MTEATPPVPRRSSWRPFAGLGLAVAGLVLFHAFFDLPGFFYEEQGWDIPSDPVEKAAYDYAHALKLPDDVPKPVPFRFWTARLRALIPGQPNVSEQYFQHLCQTEAGDFVFRHVENVEGVLQMRPRRSIYGTPIDYDRYRLEEPTGVGSGDTGTLGWRAPAELVQPPSGKYAYLEQPADPPGSVIRYFRGRNDHPPDGYKNGVDAGDRNGKMAILPFIVAKEHHEQRRARYGFTWRGIKRPHDRRYSIGAGEYLIVDLETHEVLAVKRAFKLSGRDENTPSRIWWGNARWCKGKEWEYRYLVREVLQPVPDLNERFFQANPPVEFKDLSKWGK
ncbi:MAG: hypothetical protein IPJ99_00625 [Betaproteobacteria bacterium]|nr:hypothetical protein [Betaproteobacteria bacterium]MBK8917683.1 hypothetical protein [Betaproteobacteria bacterium]